MKFLREGVTIIILLHLSDLATGQLAAIYSNVTQTSDCANWSSWGNCIWLGSSSRDRTKGKKAPGSYMQQLTPACQNHWFYKFVKTRYETAIEGFFKYLAEMTLSEKPCGMCSYKQSCGYGGPKQCNISPFAIRGGRSVLPFYVSERVCNVRDLDGHDQHESCVVDYNKALENGAECQLWPTNKVNFTGVDPNFQQYVKKLNWANCVAAPRQPGTNGTAKTNKDKVCRCCCYPFRPNPKTYTCEHIPGASEAPGQW